MARQKVRAKEDKRGSGRVVFDQAAALEALVFARGGEQLRLPVIQAAPDDAEPGRVGRPPGARSVAPELWRQWLLAKHGSVVEGLIATGTAPVVSIAAELVQAWQALAEASGLPRPVPSSAQILELVTTAASLRQAAQRYGAPYQHSPAPTQIKLDPPQQRAAIGLFVGSVDQAGRVLPASELQASGLLARLLSGTQGNQQVSEAVELDLNAADLNAARAEAPESEGK